MRQLLLSSRSHTDHIPSAGRYLNRPESLKITVCETRPSCAGVVLAERLHSVIEKSGDRAKELRQMSRPGGPAGLSQGIRERMRGEWGGSEGIGSEGGSEAGDEGEGAWSLEALVKAVDAPNPSSKVLIEVIPDGGIVAAVRMSPPGSVIVLIPAERVLPGESDVVAPTGSFMLAWCGKEIKAKVSSYPAIPTGKCLAAVGRC